MVFAQPRSAMLRALGVVVAAATAAVTLPVAASAAVLAEKPARTWGIGPAVTTLSGGSSPRVLAILPVGDRIYVAGSFDRVLDPAGKSYPVQNVAVFSRTTGAVDLRFKVSTSSMVTSLTTGGGSTLVLGGRFGTVNGAVRKGLAAVDMGSGALTSWKPTVVAPGEIDSLAYSGGWVYAAGNFTAVAGTNGSSKARLAKVNASTGAVDTSWTPAPNNRVRALNVAADGSGRLFIGGDFTSVSAKPATNKLAAVRMASPGAVDTGFRAGPTNLGAYAPVYDLTSDGGKVYVGSGGAGGACAGVNAGTGAVAWSDHATGNMQAVRLTGGVLYCGGHFSGGTSFLGQDRQKLAAVDPATGALKPFAPRINSALGVWALGADTSHLYAGGDFSLVAGMSQPHYAMFG